MKAGKLAIWPWLSCQYTDDSDVTLTPHNGRWCWISNQLSVTRNTEKSWSLIADSKFSAIYHCVASMWHLNYKHIEKSKYSSRLACNVPSFALFLSKKKTLFLPCSCIQGFAVDLQLSYKLFLWEILTLSALRKASANWSRFWRSRMRCWLNSTIADILIGVPMR